MLGQQSSSSSSECAADLQILLTSEDLGRVSKSHSEFLALLLQRAKEKGVRLGE